MTSEEILEKAIEKAQLNKYTGIMGKLFKRRITELMWMRKYYSFIFSHNFARAFTESLTKEQKESIVDGMDMPKRFAEYKPTVLFCFLQTMVLFTEPLKYLEQFLEEDK